MTITNTRPPVVKLSALNWIKSNLFSSWGSAVLSFLSLWVVYTLGKGVLAWAFVDAEWDVVVINLRLFLVGQFPADKLWRVWSGLVFLALVLGSGLAYWARSSKRITFGFAVAPLLLALLPFPLEHRLWLVALTIAGVIGWYIASTIRTKARSFIIIGSIIWLPVSIILLAGGAESNTILPKIGTNLWGGLLLTMLLTIGGIVISFPLGVLLALGRRSDLPAVKYFSIGYIELIRGVPLITILFMAQLMLPLFLPPEITIDRVLRAQIGIIMFSAAYLAENVRGGLQAIPNGQFEASHALGLSGFQTMTLIILPQALRIAIPMLVSQFIGLMKDTSLVAIVGLFDLLGIARTVLAQPDFIGLQREVYAFISLFYWVISYGMSYVSQKIETAVGLGER